MRLYKITTRLDGLGMTASILCALHCLLVPLVVAALPFWGLAFLAHPWFDKIMIGAGLLIGVSSLGVSYVQHHHRLLPLFLFITGIGLIMAVHLTHAHPDPLPAYNRIRNITLLPAYHPVHNTKEMVVLFLGGICIAAGHFLNWRYSHRCCPSQKKKIAINE